MTSMICRSRRERVVNALSVFIVGGSSWGAFSGGNFSAKNLACAKNLAHSEVSTASLIKGFATALEKSLTSCNSLKQIEIFVKRLNCDRLAASKSVVGHCSDLSTLDFWLTTFP